MSFGNPVPGSCIMCAYARFKAPTDWEPKYDGDVYDDTNALALIRTTKHHVPMFCGFMPTWIPKLSCDNCGHFSPVPHAIKNIRDFIWGPDHEEVIQLRADNKRLKKLLEGSRKKSASRLDRLKKLQPPK